MKLKKYLNSTWSVSLGSTAFGVILTVIFDFAKSKPILSTLISGIKWVWNLIIAILNFRLKVWWLLVIIIIGVITIDLLIRINDKKVDPSIINYKSDTFKVWKWSWSWKQDKYSKKWKVSDLTASCPECNSTLLSSQDIINGYSFQCPRCSFLSRGEVEEHPAKIERLIIDEVKRRK